VTHSLCLRHYTVGYKQQVPSELKGLKINLGRITPANIVPEKRIIYSPQHTFECFF
jgi:hypothetical protein